MKTKLLLLLLLASWVPMAARAASPVPPVITNIVAVQRAGTMLVDISYNLLDSDSTNLYVLVEFSADGGTTYGLPIYSLSGDVGPVRPGTNKKIVWNAWNDWANNYTTNAKVRIIADDTASAIAPPPITPPASNLVWIPSGTFQMSGGPLVWISKPFWMGKFEVTQGEFMSVMTNYNPSAFTGNTNRPVEQVTWFEATDYCARLTLRERTAGRISTNQSYRLPTEAEWEYACRAGTTTQFYYGDDPSYSRLRAYAWLDANSGGTTQPVGAKIPNHWGLFDMMGNVWEWCSDWYGGLPGGNLTDPQGPADGSYRVIRGGSWADAGDYAQSADRNYYPGYFTSYYDPGSRHGNFGFRVVLAPGQ